MSPVQFTIVRSRSFVLGEEDARKWFPRHPECPCCNELINKYVRSRSSLLIFLCSCRDTDLRQVHLEPSENHRMLLWGLAPTVVFDICASALGFYLYQAKMRSLFSA